MGTTFDNEDEFLTGVLGVLNEIPREALELVFQEWLIRLEACIPQNRDYVECDYSVEPPTFVCHVFHSWCSMKSKPASLIQLNMVFRKPSDNQ